LCMNSRTMLNRTSLIPDFMGNSFSFSPLNIMLAIGLSQIVFITLSYIPSIPNFLRAFYHEMVLNLIKGFFCIY
jgi:hypothetical protein